MQSQYVGEYLYICIRDVANLLRVETVPLSARSVLGKRDDVLRGNE